MSMRQIFEITGYKEILDGLDSLWKRAVLRTTSKGPSQSFTNTRNTTDGYSAARILPSAKAFGKAVTKRKQAKLWGRYVPCDGITNGASTSIDTGLYAVDNMEMLIRCKAISGSFYILQSRQTGNAPIYGITGSQTNDTIIFFGVTSGITRTSGHIYTIKGTYNNGAVTLYVKDESTGDEDTATGTTTAYTFPSPTTIKLFGDANMLASGATVYRAYIKVNGQMAWDMYPCVDVTNSNAPVAYNDVTHAASTVASGSITAGTLIQPISYAQTDGNACADTDLLLTGSEKWTMKFASLKSELATHVAGSLNGGTAFTDQNNFCVTYTTATTPHRYSVYVDGNAGATNNSWNSGLADDKAWHVLEYLGNVNTAPKLDGVAMATIGATARIAVTPSVPWRLFGRATTAKGTGTKSQDGVAIARFTGDTWDYLPVRIGTTVELLDLVNWQFATRTGTFTAGADVPYTELCPDIIETNVGDALYGEYGDNLVSFTRKDAIHLDANFSQGKIAANNDRTAIFIPVTGGKTYSFLVSDTLKSAGWYLVQIIADIPEIGTDYSIDGESTFVNCKGYSDYTMTTDTRTKWIGISISESKASTPTYFNQQFMMVEGSTVPTAIVPRMTGLHPSGEQKVLMGEQGVVDLGTQNWTYHTDRKVFMANIAGIIHTAASSDVKLYIDGYQYRNPYTLWNNPNDYDMSASTNEGTSSTAGIFVRDFRFTDATAFKAYMSGKYLFYQRSTDASFIPPQTRTITTFLPSATSFIDAQKAANNVECDWKFKVLDGTENWSRYVYGGRYSFRTSITDAITTGGAGRNVYCSHFNYKYAAYTEPEIGIMCFDSDSSTLLYFRADFEEVNDWKAWLAAEYAKGTPVIIAYPLATPAITTLSLTQFELNTDATRTLISQGADGQSLPVQAQYLGI